MADLYVCRFKEKMSPSSNPISRINGNFSLSAAEAVKKYNSFRKTSSDPISRINESLSRSSSEIITDYDTSRKNSSDPVSKNHGSLSISAAATMAEYTCRYDEKINVSTSVPVSSDYSKLSLSSAEATMTNNACRISTKEGESMSDTSSRINRNLFPSSAEDVIGYVHKGQEDISTSSDPDSTIHGYLSMSALTLPMEDHYKCQSTEKERISFISDPISNIEQSPASNADYVYRKYEMEETVPSSRSSGINRNLSQLLRARSKLNTVLQKCQILEEHLSKSRLHTIAQSIPPLELAFKPMRHHKKSAIDYLSLSIDKIIGPASAVLRAFDALHELEKSILQDPQHDLLGYISLVSRLEEARSFLLDNCPRTITWLEEMVIELQLRKDEDVIDEEKDACLKKISSQLETLQALQRSGEEALNLDGGLLSEALDRLEDEFQRILAMESSHIIDLDSRSPSSSPYNVDHSGKLSLETRRNLHLILQKLVMEPDGARRKRCSNIYAATRLKIIRESLKPFPLSYLHLIKSGKKLEWKKIEMHIVSWTKDIEMIVKGVCEAEYHLCSQIFQKKLGYGDLFEEAFSKISAESGLLELLRFGEASVKTRDEPEKLFKLLDMFEAMNNLRPSFSKIFGAHGCKDVQHKTRDLLKIIAQGAYNIFLELKVQIEKQRELPPAIDGRLPNILTFVSNYVKHLVGDFYRPIMVQILDICEKWKENNMSVVVKDNQAADVAKKCSNQPLSRAVLEIVNALVLNLQEWASLCKEEQPVLFHLFLCNNYWYLSVNFQASSELKAMVGEAWINNRMQEHKFHMSQYMEEGWGKIVHNLNVSSATTFTSMSRASARELLKSKLKAFNIEFEGLYEKHKKWVIPDAELREKLCVKVVKRIVPSYATYIQSYGPVLEQDGSRKKYPKYSAQDLERALGSLYQARS